MAQLAVLLQLFSNWLLVQSAEKAIDIAKPKSDIATLSDAWGRHQLAVETVVSLSWTNETVVETAPKKTVETAPLGFFHTAETLITSSPWVMQQRETKGKWDCWHAETAAVGWTESREGRKSWEKSRDESLIEAIEQWKKGFWLFRVYRGWNPTQLGIIINH